MLEIYVCLCVCVFKLTVCQVWLSACNRILPNVVLYFDSARWAGQHERPVAFWKTCSIYPNSSIHGGPDQPYFTPEHKAC